MMQLKEGSNSAQKGIRIHREKANGEGMYVDLYVAEQDLEDLQDLLFALRVPKELRQDIMAHFLVAFE